MATIATNITNKSAITSAVAFAVTGLTQRIAQYRKYRRTIDELTGLSDHELNDLGLSRNGIVTIAHESVYGA